MGIWRPRRSPSCRGACASSWRFPSRAGTCPGRAAGTGSPRQLASPAFLAQFANGCEDAAEPERHREPRDPRCGMGEPAQLGTASTAVPVAPADRLPKPNGGDEAAVPAGRWLTREPGLSASGRVLTAPSTSTAATPKRQEQIPPARALSSWFGCWFGCSGSAEVPGCPQTSLSAADSAEAAGGNVPRSARCAVGTGIAPRSCTQIRI